MVLNVRTEIVRNRFFSKFLAYQIW